MHTAFRHPSTVLACVLLTVQRSRHSPGRSTTSTGPGGRPPNADERTEPDRARAQGAAVGPRRVPRLPHRDAAVPGAEGEAGDGRPLRQDPRRARARPRRCAKPHGPRSPSTRPSSPRSAAEASARIDAAARCWTASAPSGWARPTRPSPSGAAAAATEAEAATAGRQRQRSRPPSVAVASRAVELSHRPASRRGRRAPGGRRRLEHRSPAHDRHERSSPPRRHVDETQSHSLDLSRGLRAPVRHDRLDPHLRPAVVEGRPADQEGACAAGPSASRPSSTVAAAELATAEPRRRRSARPTATSSAERARLLAEADDQRRGAAHRRAGPGWTRDRRARRPRPTPTSPPLASRGGDELRGEIATLAAAAADRVVARVARRRDPAAPHRGLHRRSVGATT